MSSSTSLQEVERTAPRRKPRRGWRDRLWSVVVRTADWVLRRWYGVREFTTDPACLLRIAVTPAPHRVQLNDETVIEVGENVAVLHIWNEQLPRFSAIGPDFRWASMIRQRLNLSLQALARHLADDPDWQDIRGVHACVTFGSRRRREQIRRAAARFGFELIPEAMPAGLHDFGEDMLIWALARVFNPAALRRRCFRRDRTELWISRADLLRRYG